jgi:acetyltransferase-like isoleucine patch superfamily enzyme
LPLAAALRYKKNRKQLNQGSQLVMPTISITNKHIGILKDHRFFAAAPHLLAQLEQRDDTIGWIKVNSKLFFRNRVKLEPYSAIYNGTYQGSKGVGQSSGLCTIGAFSYSHSPLPDGMAVGRYCSIGDGLKILDSHHPTANVSTSHFTWRIESPAVAAACSDFGIVLPQQAYFPINGYKPYPIINNDVWIGQNVTLSMGIQIGNGAVVAANSVVTKSVPDFAVVGGNPAKVIKYRFTEQQIEKLQCFQWWDYLFTDFATLNFQCIDTFSSQFVNALPTLERYKPKVVTLPRDFVD